MSLYNADATTTENRSGNWDNFYRILDEFPGSCVIEDPAAPSVSFDIEAYDEELAFHAAKDVLRRFNIVPTDIAITRVEPARPVKLKFRKRQKAVIYFNSKSGRTVRMKPGADTELRSSSKRRKRVNRVNGTRLREKAAR